MSKLENDHDLYSVNQVTVALLLLAMVLMKDSIDNDTIQAICLTCILSLIIKEVEANQDKDSVPGVSRDMTTADLSEGHPSLSTDPVTETEEEFPADSTPEHQFQEESEAHKSLGPNPEIPSSRRLIEAYSSIPSGKEINYHQGITWKPMPPKSIVPAKHSSNKEFRNLSIRFTE